MRRLQANVDSKYVIQCAKGHLRQATFKRNRSLIEKLVNLTQPPMKVYWVYDSYLCFCEMIFNNVHLFFNGETRIMFKAMQVLKAMRKLIFWLKVRSKIFFKA